MQSLQKHFLLTALAVFSFLFSLAAETRHIHVIKMLDDNSSNYIVSEGARSIDYGVDRKVQQIQSELGISTVHYYHISGTSFSREKLDEVMEYELSYQERDIILLVYVGHGYRDPSSVSQFPKLYFNNYHQGLEVEDLRLALIQKNPSLLINLIVACNVTQYDLSQPPPMPSDNNPPPVASLSPPRHLNVMSSGHGFQRLFADQPGYTKVVDLFSADRENFTFISRDGGIFFTEVLHTFQDVFGGGNYRDWNEVCHNIATRTTNRSLDRQLNQLPYCRYEVFLSTTIEVEEVALSRSECRRIARAMRQTQREELKSLRRRHREEVRALPSTHDRKYQKQLLIAGQKREKADLRLNHIQNYQRALSGCR